MKPITEKELREQIGDVLRKYENPDMREGSAPLYSGQMYRTLLNAAQYFRERDKAREFMRLSQWASKWAADIMDVVLLDIEDLQEAAQKTKGR